MNHAFNSCINQETNILTVQQILTQIQGDSLARGPKLLHIKIMLLILKGDHFQHRL